jgi:hypothetical protein
MQYGNTATLQKLIILLYCFLNYNADYKILRYRAMSEANLADKENQSRSAPSKRVQQG